jgi:hypothetical protein
VRKIDIVLFRYKRPSFGYVGELHNVLYGGLGATFVINNIRYTTDWYDKGLLGMTGLTPEQHFKQGIGEGLSSSINLSVVIFTEGLSPLYLETLTWADAEMGMMRKQLNDKLAYPEGAVSTAPLVLRMPGGFGQNLADFFFIKDKVKWENKRVALMTRFPNWDRMITMTKRIFPQSNRSLSSGQ